MVTQKRTGDSPAATPPAGGWEEVAGATIARYTTNKYIRNQTLFVQISSPALRTELGMMRKALLAKLNQKAGGTQIVTDIRFY